MPASSPVLPLPIITSNTGTTCFYSAPGANLFHCLFDDRNRVGINPHSNIVWISRALLGSSCEEDSSTFSPLLFDLSIFTLRTNLFHNLATITSLCYGISVFHSFYFTKIRERLNLYLGNWLSSHGLV